MMFVRSFCGAAPAGPFVARRAFAWVVALFWISPALFSLIRQVKGIRYSGTGSHATLAKKTCRHQASPAPPGRALNDGPTQPFFSLTKQGLCCIEIITASALYLNMAGIQHCVVRIKKKKKKSTLAHVHLAAPPLPCTQMDGCLRHQHRPLPVIFSFLAVCVHTEQPRFFISRIGFFLPFPSPVPKAYVGLCLQVMRPSSWMYRKSG